jgi:transcriptional regulator with XRE-family HTH domain
MSHFNLTPKELAERLSVQRSSISHILNGRNKPSVAFITKMSEEFPDLNTSWILYGKAPMITNVNAGEEEPIVDNESPDFSEVVQEILEDTSVNTVTKEARQKHIDSSSLNKKIEKVVWFYSDGTFKIFQPSEE